MEASSVQIFTTVKTKVSISTKRSATRVQIYEGISRSSIERIKEFEGDKIAKIQDEMVEKVINSKYVEAEFDEEDWSKDNVNIYFTENIEEVNELMLIVEHLRLSLARRNKKSIRNITTWLVKM